MQRSLEAIGIGIDVGGTKVLASAITAEGDELAEASEHSPATPDGLLPVLSDLVAALLKSLGDERRRVRGVGIALPGIVDRAGVLHAAPNLGGAVGSFDAPTVLAQPLLAQLRAQDVALDRPVRFENDATCAAIGEVLLGAAKGATDAIVISFGTGIGAGIVANGRLVRGARGFAGEIGHMVIDPDGPRCPCGRRGCWEMFASGGALSRLAREHGHVGDAAGAADGSLHLDALGLVQAARAGEPEALALIDRFAHYVGLGLTNVVELLDPDMIVIAGGLANSADVLLGPILAAFDDLSRQAQRIDHSHVVVATLRNRAASVGVALASLGQLD